MSRSSLSPFDFKSLAIRIRFDVDAAAVLACEADRVGISRPLFVAMPGERSRKEAEAFVRVFAPGKTAVFSDAKVHVPTEILEAALAAYDAAGADGVIAIGGGSAIGLGKLVAFRRGAKSIVIPTTYSGAEVTPFNAVTRDGVKTQIRDDAVTPALVLYDIGLTLGLPMRIAVPSMMNALAHAVEALYAPDGNPLVSLEAEEALRCGVPALERLAADPESRAVRRDLLFASMLAGRASAVTTMALHHKLCHVLGGAHDLNHADVNAVILPHALCYNAPGAPEAMARIGRALATRTPAARLFDIAKEAGAPVALRDIGMRESDLEPALEIALAQKYENPVPLEAKGLRKLLNDAYRGVRPAEG